MHGRLIPPAALETPAMVFESQSKGEAIKQMLMVSEQEIVWEKH